MREELRVREYGNSGPPVIVLHGGPGAAGSAAKLARELGEDFRTLEPWQRGGGGEPRTVEGHIEDLHALIESRYTDVLPALVGHSWGAMLALAYAAAHPERVSTVVLVSCGTFDRKSRARMLEILGERMDDDLRNRIAALPETVPDPDERLREIYRLTRPLYDYDPVEENALPELESFDVRAHTETWADMLRLQEAGVYPATFAAVVCPALMLHGAYDPHPGRMIRESLHPFLPQLEYREWERCGHDPWRERAVREAFFAVLRDWLFRHVTERTANP